MFGEDESIPPDEWQGGLIIAFALHVFQLLLTPLTNVYSLWFIGLSQLLYILPAIALCKRNKRDDYIKGLIIGASITFLLNASCLTLFRGFWGW